MKLVFKKTIIEQIQEMLFDAKRTNNNKIDYILLTTDEYFQLKQELCLPKNPKSLYLFGYQVRVTG
jgi:hypothetical protein